MYAERRARGELARVALCTWQSECERDRTARILPDACTDIMWNDRDLVVAGPDTRPMLQRLAAGDMHVAVRLAPGKAGVLGVPLSALRDARVPLAELWGDPARALADRLAAAGDAREVGALLQAGIEQQLTAAVRPDPLVQRVVAEYQVLEPLTSIAECAAELGITERQLLRRCTAALGYGPKLLARILRFQRFLGCVGAEPSRSLAAIAQDCGYADQAHLAHDTAEFAGVSPRELRAERSMSDLHKPASRHRLQTRRHENTDEERPLAV